MCCTETKCASVFTRTSVYTKIVGRSMLPKASTTKVQYKSLSNKASDSMSQVIAAIHGIRHGYASGIIPLVIPWDLALANVCGSPLSEQSSNWASL